MSLDELLDRLESLMAEVDASDEEVRQLVYELLDGIDSLHRLALAELGAALGSDALAVARTSHPAVAWLLDVYGVRREPAPAGPVPVEIRPRRR